jgi:hypothetical protein
MKPTTFCNHFNFLITVGHRRRQISGLNGPAHTRFGGEEEDEATSGIKLHKKPDFENHLENNAEYSDLGQNSEFSDPGYNEYAGPNFNTTHNFEKNNQLQFTENFENMSISSDQSQRYSKPTKGSSSRPPNNIFNEPYNEPPPATVETFIKPLRPSSAPPSSSNHISPRRNKEKETRFNFENSTPETPDKDQRDPSKASQSPKELAYLNKYNQLGQQFIDEKAQQTLKDNKQSIDFQKQSTANPYQYEKILNENTEYDEISESGYSIPSSVRSFDSSTYSMPSYPQRTNPNPKSPGFKGMFKCFYILMDLRISIPEYRVLYSAKRSLG